MKSKFCSIRLPAGGPSGRVYYPERLLLLIPHRDCLGVLRDYRRRLFAWGLPGAWSFPEALPLACLSRALTGAELRALARRLREWLAEAKLVSGALETVPVPGAGNNVDTPLRTPGGPLLLLGPGMSPDPIEGIGDLLSQIDREARVFAAPVLCAALLAVCCTSYEVQLKKGIFCPWGDKKSTLQTALQPLGTGDCGTNYRGTLCRNPPKCNRLLGPGDRDRLGEAAAPPALSFRAAQVANCEFGPLISGPGAYSYQWETGPGVWLPSAAQLQSICQF